MPLLGTGVPAIWNGVAPGYDAEFLEWHVKEHIPERVGVPGFLRARRYFAVDGTPAYFNFYETETYQVLSSEPYLARLNDPTPWTRKVVSNFQDTSRTICDVAQRRGEASAPGSRPSSCRPQSIPPSSPAGWRADCWPRSPSSAACSAVHLLRGVPEANKADTAEKAMRGVRDKEAAWILLVETVAAQAALDLRGDLTGDASLAQAGVTGKPVRGLYQLDFALARTDL